MDRSLFLDDWHIARMQGLERCAHAAERYLGNPLIVKEFPWELGRLQLFNHSVVYNEERRLFQMFYMAQPVGSDHPNIRVGGNVKSGNATLPAYAESTDGIRWYRPLRSDVAFEDITQTNLLDLHMGQSYEPGILWDPHDPDPQRRYKALIWDQQYNVPVPGKLNYELRPMQGSRILTTAIRQILDDGGKVIFEELYNDWGLRVAFSHDGIHWTKYPGWVMWCYCDGGTSPFYDTRLGKYVAFGRFNKQEAHGIHSTPDESPERRSGGGAFYYIGRNISRIESTDFIHWSEPEMVLTVDDKDPEGLQINTMPVDLYEGIYVGLMELDIRPQPSHFAAADISKYPGRGPVRPFPMQLAMSRDGRRWNRVADRFAFLDKPDDEGAWDQRGPTGYVRPATGLFVYNDRVRFYYSAGPTKEENYQLGVGMASWRRDGFVSLHAGPDGGELLTRSFISDGPELHLNIDALQGEATVQVCDLQGYPVRSWTVSQSSQPIRGDHVATVVRWEESDLAEKMGKPITVRVQMKNADLYSFWTA